MISVWTCGEPGRSAYREIEEGHTYPSVSGRFVKVSQGGHKERVPWCVVLVRPQRTATGLGDRSPNAPRELASDEVPDIMRPALEHASPRHDMQTIASRVRVRPEQRRSVDGKEVDIGVFPRLEDRLQGCR